MPNTGHEIILSFMKLSENYKQQGYAQLREALTISWYKLFKSTRESIVRKWVPVVKGIAEYPCSAENILGLYNVDSCGDLRPLYEDNIKSILPMPAEKCKCTQADHLDCLCPAVAEVEPVVVEVLIEGVTYTNKYFTKVLKSGCILEEKFEWIAAYDNNGVFEDAVETKSKKVISQLEMNSCGCPANTEENVKKLCGCGCFDSCCAPFLRDRYPAFYNEFGYYKQDHENRRIHVFDSNGKKSKIKWVEIKFQSNGDDMVVPDYAKPALLAMLNWYRMLYSPMYGPGDRIEAKRNFNREKKEMLRELNPIPWELMMQGYPALPVSRRGGNIWYSSPEPTVSDNYAPSISVPSAVQQTIINNHNTTHLNQYKRIRVFVDGEAGSPVIGETEWISADLQGIDVNEIPLIFVNKNYETQGKDFTIDPTEGKLIRQSPWIDEDELYIPLFKKS